MACGKMMNLEVKKDVVTSIIRHISEQERNMINILVEINKRFDKIESDEKEQELLLQAEFDDINTRISQVEEILQKEISDNHSRFKRLKARK